jgi:hypothetical protein
MRPAIDPGNEDAVTVGSANMPVSTMYTAISDQFLVLRQRELSVTSAMSNLSLLLLDHRQIQREKTWILPDEMRVIFSDALREHGNRGVSHGIHSKPPFSARTYALGGSPAIVRREYSMSNVGADSEPIAITN